MLRCFCVYYCVIYIVFMLCLSYKWPLHCNLARQYLRIKMFLLFIFATEGRLLWHGTVEDQMLLFH
jgi:hypothetical protein